MRRVIIALTGVLLLLGCGKKKPTESEEGVSGHTYYSGTTIPVSGVLVAIDNETYTTGSDGHYQLDNVPTGSQTISATKANCDPYTQTINVPNTGLVHNIEITSDMYAHKVYGTVTNGLSEGISNVKVAVLNPDSSESQLWTTTAATGYYQIPAVPQGNRIVRFSTTYYETLDVALFITNDDYQYDAQLISSPIDPPTGLSAGPYVKDNRRILVSWNTRNDHTLKGYRLYHSLQPEAGYIIISEILFPSVDTCVDTVLGTGVTYYYKIASLNIDNVEGQLSPYTSSTTFDSFDVIAEYSAPGTHTTGLGWDGSNLWSCDAQENRFYKYDANMDVIGVYNSPGDGPGDLAWDGSNFWSIDLKTDKIYKHNTNMDTIASYDVDIVGGISGIAWDGLNLWISGGCVWEPDIYKLDSNMNIIGSHKYDSVSVGDLAWDGIHLWFYCWQHHNLHKISGNGSIIASYHYYYLSGIEWCGDYLWGCKGKWILKFLP